MTQIRVILPGKPIPWKRARTCHGRYFDAQTDVKTWMREELLSQIGRITPFTVPVVLCIEAHMPFPNSWSKKKRALLLGTPHHSRPDLSNIVKLIEDAFNGYLWADDSLIGRIVADKRYSLASKTVVKCEPLI